VWVLPQRTGLFCLHRHDVTSSNVLATANHCKRSTTPVCMEQPADRAEAAAVTTTFRRRLKTFPVDPAYMDTEKQSDGCFVMRPRSPSRRGAQYKCPVTVTVIIYSLELSAVVHPSGFLSRYSVTCLPLVICINVYCIVCVCACVCLYGPCRLT